MGLGHGRCTLVGDLGTSRHQGDPRSPPRRLCPTLQPGGFAPCEQEGGDAGNNTGGSGAEERGAPRPPPLPSWGHKPLCTHGCPPAVAVPVRGAPGSLLLAGGELADLAAGRAGFARGVGGGAGSPLRLGFGAQLPRLRPVHADGLGQPPAAALPVLPGLLLRHLSCKGSQASGRQPPSLPTTRHRFCSPLPPVSFSLEGTSHSPVHPPAGLPGAWWGWRARTWLLHRTERSASPPEVHNHPEQHAGAQVPPQELRSTCRTSGAPQELRHTPAPGEDVQQEHSSHSPCSEQPHLPPRSSCGAVPSGIPLPPRPDGAQVTALGAGSDTGPPQHSPSWSRRG